MRTKKYSRPQRPALRETFHIPVKFLIIPLFILLLFAGSFIAGRLRRAESAFLENGAYRWGTALLAECADMGMNAVDGPLIQIDRDTAGDIQMISVDSEALHILRTETIRQAEKMMTENTVHMVKIPLGTIIASEFFSGIGPSIPFYYAPVGSTTVLCHSSLESAGINQTAYRVTLSMTMEISAVTSFASHHITVPYEVVVAETMIVGDVPAVYAYGAKDETGRKS